MNFFKTKKIDRPWGLQQILTKCFIDKSMDEFELSKFRSSLLSEHIVKLIQTIIYSCPIPDQPVQTQYGHVWCANGLINQGIDLKEGFTLEHYGNLIHYLEFNDIEKGLVIEIHSYIDIKKLT